MIHGCVTEIGKRSLKYVPLSDQGKPVVPATPPVEVPAQLEDDCGMGAACVSWSTVLQMLMGAGR
jgi:hypothetical protein